MQVRRFESPASFVNSAASLLIESIGEGARPRAPRAVVLSGGKTPLPIYAAVAQSGARASQDCHVIFSDERMVPVDSPESNYANARAMIEALGIPDSRVVRVHTELPLNEAADRYHENLERFLEKGGTIPLALLGLGADGHTASLFTATDLTRALGRYAVAVPRTPGPDRVSVTPGLLRHVTRVIFLVSGNDKRDMAERLLSSPDFVIAGRATLGIEPLELWMA